MALKVFPWRVAGRVAAWGGLLALSLFLGALGTCTPVRAQDSPCTGPHDSVDTACPLGTGSALQEPISAVGGRNVYRFDVQSPGTRVQVDLTDLPADYDLYLVDGGGSIVDQSVQEGTTPERLDRTLDSKGAFFVYVVADPGRAADTSAPYTLGFRLIGPKAEWTLLRSDDFTDPVHGLFLDRQQGTRQARLRTGGNFQHSFAYGYTDGSLRVVVGGPFRQDGDWPEVRPEALGRFGGEFAAEVRARATGAPGVARYALAYSLADESYFFGLFPGSRSYVLAREGTPGLSGRDGAIYPGGGENLLRMEVRGETISVFANGVMLEQVRRPGIAGESGHLRLGAAMTGPGEGEVEVRFTDFKVYKLAS